MKASDFHYILGFLTCDGSFDPNGYTVGLQIQERDEEILDHFWWFVFWVVTGLPKHQRLKTEPHKDRRKIGEFRYVRLRVHSKFLHEHLTGMFGGRLKADRKWPAWASLAFLRGVWDADGHFQARRNTIEGEISHPSREWMEDLAAFIESESGFGTRKIEEREGCWRLGVSASICNWFRDFVYASPPFLDRKRLVLGNYHQPGHRRRWQQWQIDYLTEHFKSGTESWREIAVEIGKTPKAVSKKIWQLDLTKRDE